MYIVTAGAVVELAIMCLGLLSHCRGCMSKSMQCMLLAFLSGIMMSQSELGDKLHHV